MNLEHKDIALEIKKNMPYVAELCSHCNDEVMIRDTFENQNCPSCGKPIKPCSWKYDGESAQPCNRNCENCGPVVSEKEGRRNSIGDIILAVKKMASGQELISLNDVMKSSRKVNGALISDEDIASFESSTGLSRDNVYCLEGAISPFIFIDGTFMIEFPLLDCSRIFTSEQILTARETHQRYLSDRDYLRIMMYAPSSMKVVIYHALYPELTDEEKIDLFLHIYVQSDFAMSALPLSQLDEVLDLLQNNSSYRKIPSELIDDDGKITIYRGMGTRSTNVEDALSWTLDSFTAIKFATRWENNSFTLYKARADIKEVIAYIMSRREKEVLIKYENLLEIEKIDQIDVDAFARLVDDDELEVIREFRVLACANRNLFHNFEGIHGYGHSYRMLLFLLLANLEGNLSNRDFDLLSVAAVLHDMGRKTDDVEMGHGRASAQMIKAGFVNHLGSFIDDEDVDLLCQIIEMHDIDDYMIEREKFDEETKRLIYLFKDFDALDRVRIGDLNLQYLRNSFAMRYASLSAVFFKNINIKV